MALLEVEENNQNYTKVKPCGRKVNKVKWRGREKSFRVPELTRKICKEFFFFSFAPRLMEKEVRSALTSPCMPLIELLRLLPCSLHFVEVVEIATALCWCEKRLHLKLHTY